MKSQKSFAVQAASGFFKNGCFSKIKT